MSEYIVDYTIQPRGGMSAFDVREEIVRCRDCKHFASDELGDCCTLLDFEDVRSMDDGFCAWGERREA